MALGPLRPGRRDYSATVSGCGPEAPCRLVSLALAGTSAADGSEGTPPPPGSALTLHALGQRGPDASVVGQQEFADRSRWRNEVRRDARLPVLATTEDGLRLLIDALPRRGRAGCSASPAFPSAVYALDAALPLPVIASAAAAGRR